MVYSFRTSAHVSPATFFRRVAASVDLAHSNMQVTLPPSIFLFLSGFGCSCVTMCFRYRIIPLLPHPSSSSLISLMSFCALLARVYQCTPRKDVGLTADVIEDGVGRTLIFCPSSVFTGLLFIIAPRFAAASLCGAWVEHQSSSCCGPVHRAFLTVPPSSHLRSLSTHPLILPLDFSTACIAFLLERSFGIGCHIIISTIFVSTTVSPPSTPIIYLTPTILSRLFIPPHLFFYRLPSLLAYGAPHLVASWSLFIISVAIMSLYQV